MPDGRLLRWPLALALLVHAVVLGALQAQRPGISAGSPDGAPSVRARVVAAPPAPLPEPAATTAAADPLIPPAVAQAVPAAPAPSAEPSQDAGAAQAVAAGLSSAKEQGGDFSGYFPRSMLTQGPRPRTSMEVPFPADIKGKVDMKVAVALYIDETGKVRNVRIETEPVAQAFVDAIRRTFDSARFQPGMIGDTPVRALVRVEVVFENDAGASGAPRQPGS